MEKLLNDQVLKMPGFLQQNQTNDDVLVEISVQDLEFENKIGNGNLQDYLEIFGELGDN